MPTAEMSRVTILHVDDDSNDILLFHHACQKGGLPCNVASVEDGERAISYLRGEDEFANRQRYPLPRLVLLDLKMPRVTGFDVLAWMRNDEQLRAMPVVVLSSSNHDADVKRAYDLGANSYLLKPVGFDALVEIARSLDQYWLGMNVRTS
jgi:CheY-like chemotaxis protein